MEKMSGQKWKDKELKRIEGTLMGLKQCICGRSLRYPYCDGTHNVKKDSDSIESDKKDKE
jgi:CDGSH-type Zn-finger protein